MQYKDLTKAELKALCDKEGITYKKNATQDKLIELLNDIETVEASSKIKAFYTSKGRERLVGEYSSSEEAVIALQKVGATVSRLE